MKPRFFLLLAGLLGASRVDAAPSDELRAAIALCDSNKLPEAKQALEKFPGTSPEAAEVNYYLGFIAYRQKDPEAAVEFLKKSAERAPKDARTQRLLGAAYGDCALKASLWSKIGLAKKCQAAFERAVELEPGNTDYRGSLMAFYQQAPGFLGGSMEKAREQAAEIKRLNRVEGCQAFAQLYLAEKKYDEAFAAMAEATRVAPDDYGLFYGLGKMAASTHQHLDDGIAAFKRCLELTPKPGQATHDAAWGRIGQLYEMKGDLASARSAFETALKLNPESKLAGELLKKLPAAPPAAASSL